MGRADVSPEPAAQVASRDLALARLRDVLAAYEDSPAARLRICRAVRDAARAEEDRAVQDARAAGMTFKAIAQRLGITPEAVRQRVQGSKLRPVIAAGAEGSRR